MHDKETIDFMAYTPLHNSRTQRPALIPLRLTTSARYNVYVDVTQPVKLALFNVPVVFIRVSAPGPTPLPERLPFVRHLHRPANIDGYYGTGFYLGTSRCNDRSVLLETKRLAVGTVRQEALPEAKSLARFQTIVHGFRDDLMAFGVADHSAVERGRSAAGTNRKPATPLQSLRWKCTWRSLFVFS